MRLQSNMADGTNDFESQNAVEQTSSFEPSGIENILVGVGVWRTLMMITEKYYHINCPCESSEVEIEEPRVEEKLCSTCHVRQQILSKAPKLQPSDSTKTQKVPPFEHVYQSFVYMFTTNTDSSSSQTQILTDMTESLQKLCKSCEERILTKEGQTMLEVSVPSEISHQKFTLNHFLSSLCQWKKAEDDFRENQVHFLICSACLESISYSTSDVNDVKLLQHVATMLRNHAESPKSKLLKANGRTPITADAQSPEKRPNGLKSDQHKDKNGSSQHGILKSSLIKKENSAVSLAAKAFPNGALLSSNGGAPGIFSHLANRPPSNGILLIRSATNPPKSVILKPRPKSSSTGKRASYKFADKRFNHAPNCETSDGQKQQVSAKVVIKMTDSIGQLSTMSRGERSMLRSAFSSRLNNPTVLLRNAIPGLVAGQLVSLPNKSNPKPQGLRATKEHLDIGAIKFIPDSAKAQSNTSPVKFSIQQSGEISEKVKTGQQPQEKPRTPLKLRSPRKSRAAVARSPAMKKAVASYLAAASESEGTKGSARKTRTHSSRSAPVRKTIPIPYEAHYLCLDTTLNKKGWKAYWYKKCRCVKSQHALRKVQGDSPSPVAPAAPRAGVLAPGTPQGDLAPSGHDSRIRPCVVGLDRAECSKFEPSLVDKEDESSAEKTSEKYLEDTYSAVRLDKSSAEKRNLSRMKRKENDVDSAEKMNASPAEQSSENSPQAESSAVKLDQKFSENLDKIPAQKASKNVAENDENSAAQLDQISADEMNECLPEKLDSKPVQKTDHNSPNKASESFAEKSEIFTEKDSTTFEVNLDESSPGKASEDSTEKKDQGPLEKADENSAEKMDESSIGKENESLTEKENVLPITESLKAVEANIIEQNPSLNLENNDVETCPTLNDTQGDTIINLESECCEELPAPEFNHGDEKDLGDPPNDHTQVPSPEICLEGSFDSNGSTENNHNCEESTTSLESISISENDMDDSEAEIFPKGSNEAASLGHNLPPNEATISKDQQGPSPGSKSDTDVHAADTCSESDGASIFHQSEATTFKDQQLVQDTENSPLDAPSTAEQGLNESNCPENPQNHTGLQSEVKLNQQRPLQLPKPVTRDPTLVAERREKLQLALKTLGEKAEQLFYERLTSHVIFTQVHEPVDKQPACLDLVSDLREKASQNPAEQNPRTTALLKENLDPALRPASKAAKISSPFRDLDTIWSHGKQLDFFNAPKLGRPIQSLYSIKRPMANGLSRLKNIKRSFQPRKMQQQRIINNKPIKFSPLKQENAVIANESFNYKLPLEIWKAPATGVSTVAARLSSLWGESTPDDVISTPSAPKRPYGAVGIKRRQIDHALGALCKDDEIFTFSSTRVKPRNGQTNVLVIRRKPICGNLRPESPPPAQCPCLQMKADAYDSDSAVPEPSPGSEGFGSNPASVSANSSKILLKLKKVKSANASLPVLYTTGDSENELGPSQTETVDLKTSPTLELRNNEITNTSTEQNPPKDSENILDATPLNLSDHAAALLDDLTREVSRRLAADEIYHTPPRGGATDSSLLDEWSTPPSSPKRVETPFHFPPLDASTPHALRDTQNDVIDDVFGEERDYEITDWESGVRGGDEVDRFLSKLTRSSLDFLEDILLLRGSPDDLPPLRFVISMQEFRQKNGWFDVAPKISESLALESPEAPRGITRSKPCRNGSLVAPLSPGVNEFRGSPVSPGPFVEVQSTPVANGDAEQLIPPDPQGEQEEENTSGDAQSAPAQLSPIQERMKRTYKKKLLRNHALNGAYWSSGFLRPEDGVCSEDEVEAKPWMLRDRRKRGASWSSAGKSCDPLNDDEDEDVDVEDDSCEELPIKPSYGPKRKRMGPVEYSPLSDDLLTKQLCRLFDDSNKKQQKEFDNRAAASSSTKDARTFEALLGSRVILSQVKSWMLESTCIRPRPLINPILTARRNRLASLAKSSGGRSRRASSVQSSTSSSTLASEAGRPGRPRKHNPERSKRESKANPRNDDLTQGTSRERGSQPQDRELETLRKRLFTLRHPEYRGDLAADPGAWEIPGIPTAPCLNLPRIDEDAANSSAGAIFTPNLLQGEKGDPQPPRKRRRVFPACRTPPSDHEYLHEGIPASPKKAPAPRVYSGRGRPPKNLARVIAPVVVTSPAVTEGVRQNSRFANKHSTRGAYLLKVLESGDFDCFK